MQGYMARKPGKHKAGVRNATKETLNNGEGILIVLGSFEQCS